MANQREFTHPTPLYRLKTGVAVEKGEKLAAG
jgi:hypothetical protein